MRWAALLAAAAVTAIDSPFAYAVSAEQPFCFAHYLTFNEKMIVGYAWTRTVPAQQLQLGFLDARGAPLVPVQLSPYEQHKYLYIHTENPQEVRVCVGVSEGETRVALAFKLSSAAELSLPEREDAARLADLLSSASAALQGFRARQRELDRDELTHFSYNEALDRQLRLITLTEVLVISLTFLAGVLVLVRQLRAKEFL